MRNLIEMNQPPFLETYFFWVHLHSVLRFLLPKRVKADLFALMKTLHLPAVVSITAVVPGGTCYRLLGGTVVMAQAVHAGGGGTVSLQEIFHAGLGGTIDILIRDGGKRCLIFGWSRVIR